ncbi:hypothetical protein M8818_004339 [Zalaria obscura]|uniref:Uncharacterized protein n=1 Tax=Zalaria obscura TaxID=2024903 RepID=A0ACC3SBN6_9PEZI
MRFSVAAASAALVAGAAAQYNSTAPVYVTEVVTAFTTYCPEATSLVHNGVTYTVSEATTLTITDCPCTVTKPASSAAAVATSSVTSVAAVSSVAESSVVVVASSSEAAPVAASSAAASSAVVVAPIYSNGTTGAASSVAPAGTAAASTAGSASTATGSPIATYTGAANKAYSASGAGLAAIFGLNEWLECEVRGMDNMGSERTGVRASHDNNMGSTCKHDLRIFITQSVS